MFAPEGFLFRPRLSSSLTTPRTTGSDFGQFDPAQRPVCENRAAVPRRPQPLGCCTEAMFAAPASGGFVHTLLIRSKSIAAACPNGGFSRRVVASVFAELQQ